MRLIVECEHDRDDWCVVCDCDGPRSLTDPDAILAALAEAGVLKVEHREIIDNSIDPDPYWADRYVSPWKETK